MTDWLDTIPITCCVDGQAHEVTDQSAGSWPTTPHSTPRCVSMLRGPGEVVKGYRTAVPEGLADASALWRW